MLGSRNRKPGSGLPLILSTMALVVLWAATTTQAAEFGTPEEAKAMLDKAVAAVKENKEKAFAMCAHDCPSDEANNP
jgi:hypothetical protein